MSNPADLLEKTIIAIKHNTFYNTKVFATELGFILPKSFYIKALTLPVQYDFHTQDTLDNTFKIYIDIKDLKSNNSKKVKKLCAYALINDFNILEIIYILHRDRSVTCHRRLLGNKKRETI